MNKKIAAISYIFILMILILASCAFKKDVDEIQDFAQVIENSSLQIEESIIIKNEQTTGQAVDEISKTTDANGTESVTIDDSPDDGVVPVFRYNGCLYIGYETYFILMGMRVYELDDNCICLGTIDADKTVPGGGIPEEDFASNFAMDSFNIYQYDENYEIVVTENGDYIRLWRKRDREEESGTGFYIRYDGRLYERLNESYSVLMGVSADNIADKCRCLGTIDAGKTVEKDEVPEEDFASNFATDSIDIYQYDAHNKKLVTVEGEYMVLWKCISE